MGSTKRAIVVAAFALVTLSAAALADSAVSQSGTVGRYNVIDSASKPGVFCSPELSLGENGVRIDVRGPKVWAVDDTAGLDEQSVGWKWSIRFKQGDHWTSFKGDLTKASATDETPYVFPAGVFKVTSGSPRYVVRQTMYWYSQLGIQTGRVTRQVEYYRQGPLPTDTVMGPNGNCHPF